MIEMDDKDIRRAMAGLSRAMRSDKTGRLMKRELSKQLRGVAEPMAKRRKSAVLALPSSGSHRGPSMRQAIARQIKAATRWSGKQGGVSVIQRARSMPRNFNMAGRVFNRREGWNPKSIVGEVRHQQIRPVAWFDSASDARETKLARQEIGQALKAAADKLGVDIRRI